MMASIVAGVTIGALAGGVIGAFGTRRRHMIFIYMAAGALGAALYVCLPLLRGFDYVNTNPKMITIVSVIASGLAVLFTSGRGLR